MRRWLGRAQPALTADDVGQQHHTLSAVRERGFSIGLESSARQGFGRCGSFRHSHQCANGASGPMTRRRRLPLHARCSAVTRHKDRRRSAPTTGRGRPTAGRRATWCHVRCSSLRRTTSAVASAVHQGRCSHRHFRCVGESARSAIRPRDAPSTRRQAAIASPPRSRRIACRCGCRSACRSASGRHRPRAR